MDRKGGHQGHRIRGRSACRSGNGIRDRQLSRQSAPKGSTSAAQQKHLQSRVFALCTGCITLALQLWWVEPGPAGGLWLGRGLARAFQSLQARLTHGGYGLKVGVEALQLHTPFAAEKPLGDLGAAALLQGLLHHEKTRRSCRPKAARAHCSGLMQFP